MIKTSKEIQEQVISLRQKGVTYKNIMSETSLSKNTIIKICKQHGLISETPAVKQYVCKNCNLPYTYKKGNTCGTTKLFCCKDCSIEYRNTHFYNTKKKVEKISDFYQSKGYNRLYIANDKSSNRLIATIRKPNGEMHSMSYAKYLYTSHYNCDISEGVEVDHINGDKNDNRIENLQIISKNYNILKDHKHKTMVELECPVCHKKFLYEYRNLRTHKEPCCSRHCGGIKSHWNM